MKILFINTLYAPFQVGGAEVSVRIMAEELAASGHRVYVLTLGYNTSVRRLNGVVVVSIKTRNLYHIEQAAGQKSYKKLFWHLLDSSNAFYRREIGKLLDRIQPDVVNTNNIQGFSPYIWKLVNSRGIKLVHTMRDYYLLCHKTSMYSEGKDCTELCKACKLTYSIKKPYFELPDAYIGISSFILKQHERFGLGETKPQRVISNGMRGSGQSRDFKSPSSEVVFGFIGKVNEQKGVGFLFEELAALSRQEGSFRLVLAGKADPEFEAGLREKFDGVFEFTFLGKTDSDAFYRSVDVVIVPSGWNEPFGRIPIEATASGTPVCLADKGGLSELYDERCMWQFEMKKNSLRDLLKGILKNRMVIAEKSAACALLDDAYSPALLNKRFIDFINTVNG